MFKRKKINSIPKRELNWKKYSYLRNNQKNVFYDCECGKRYISFPAIFLHFQRKHNRKISINQQNHEFQSRIQNNEYIYYFSINKKQIPQGTHKKQKYFDNQKVIFYRMSQISRKFVQQFQNELENFVDIELLQKIFVKFNIFLLGLLDEKKFPISQEEILKTIPVYFNEFFMSQKLLFDGKILQNYNSLCWGFLKFSHWLYQNHISDVIVQMNNA